VTVNRSGRGRGSIESATSPFAVAAASLQAADGSRQVSLRGNGYTGPGAPAGPYHHYTFELHALDTKLDVPQGTPQQAAETRTAVVGRDAGGVVVRRSSDEAWAEILKKRRNVRFSGADALRTSG
jgi:hypothetical protein